MALGCNVSPGSRGVGGAALLGAVLLAACGSASSGGSASSSAPSAPTTAAAAAPAATAPTTAAAVVTTIAGTPTAFTSDVYRYALTVPATWQAAAAKEAWDGTAPAPNHEDSRADVLSRPDGATVAAISFPTTQRLAAYADAWVARTAAEHGDTCPNGPAGREKVSVGGGPGVLLSFDCGILIDIAVAVHDGAGYAFVFRDAGVEAATDPADHEAFVRLLRSVKFDG